MANLSLSDVSLRGFLGEREYLSIFLDTSVSGIIWDASKEEVRIKMQSRTSLTLQEYRDEKAVNEFMKQIEGDGHAT
jgi:hypothetical protein